ncbi:outer membrane protein assembly factor BamB family protein [Planctopirus hydrillae]|nr:PQQ-binding-like beta-propeller repeat protein [Planctopirus hydrillae]
MNARSHDNSCGWWQSRCGCQQLCYLFVIPLWLFTSGNGLQITIAQELPGVREAWTFNFSEPALRQLDAVRENMEAGQWSEAVEMVESVLESSAHELVALNQLAWIGEAQTAAWAGQKNLEKEISGPQFSRKSSPGQRVLNVELTVRQILSVWPEEGRKVYREKFDPKARRWWGEYQSTGDVSFLERIVQRAWLASDGDLAVDELAHHAFRQREYITARLLWQSLLQPELRMKLSRFSMVQVHAEATYPDSDLPAADVVARIVLCRLFSGDEPGTAAGIELLAKEFPEAKGKLGDQEGKWFELIDQVRAALIERSIRQSEPGARQNPRSTSSAAHLVHDEQKTAIAESPVMFSRRGWAKRVEDLTLPRTWGGIPSRTGNTGPAFDLGAPVWSANIPQEKLSLYKPTEQRLLADVPASYPLIWNNLVLLPTANQIMAWDVVSGRPAWKTALDANASIYPPNGGESLVPPILPSRGRPAYSLTVSDERLYARLGWPVTLKAENETRDAGGQLICLDVGKEQGKLHWSVLPADLFEEGESWEFAGTPVVRNGAVYTILTRSRAVIEWALMCQDAETGNLRWLTRLGYGRTTLLPNVNQLGLALATVQEGFVIVSVEPGGVICVDGKTGRALWGVALKVVPGEDPRWPYVVLPCLAENEVVIAAPAGTDELLALDLATGAALWSRPQPEKLSQWLGIRDGSLFAGGKSLWAMELKSGKTDWQFEQSDPEWMSYGQGLFAGESILWPAREALFEIDPQSGTPTRIHHWQISGSECAGGHLALVKGRLVVSQRDRIVVYGEEAGVVRPALGQR